MSGDLIIHGEKIPRGARRHIHITIARLYDSTEMSLDVEVVRGNNSGPTLFLAGAVHGDELNGTEIIRRLLTSDCMKNLKGTIIAAPIVNAYGFNTKSRYLPDRRDLNRCFPGSEGGSLAAQLADVFIREVVDNSTHGIDLHTGAINRTNWPQIRGCMDDARVAAMAADFAAPVTLDEPLREGSLREYCHAHDIPVLLYEGGEALRFQKRAIQEGYDGILRVMAGLGMIESTYAPVPESPTRHVQGSFWVRAPQSGMLITRKKLGDTVDEGEILGVMTDAFGHDVVDILSPSAGIIIGATTTPLLNQGDATYHIAHNS